MNDVNIHIDDEEFTPGDSLLIKHQLSYNRVDGDLSPYLHLPLEELEKQRARSAAVEQTLFNGVREAAQKWDEQAANTLRLNKAIEYRRTPAVAHSSNRWIKNEYGSLEISNMVYRMYYRVREETRYNRETKQMERTGWSLSWYILLNTGNRKTYDSTCIVGQRDKYFTEQDKLQKYVQGRFNAYSHLFQEISPPIPPAHADKFKVNGCLLPGYTVESAEPSKPISAHKQKSNRER